MNTDPVSVRRAPSQDSHSDSVRFGALTVLASLLRFSAVAVAVVATIALYGRLVASAVTPIGVEAVQPDYLQIFRDFGSSLLDAIELKISAELILLALQIEKNTRK